MYSLDNIYKSFDNNQVLKGVSLEIPKNKTTVLIGPSGSGKTTLLRCINLLEIPDSGTVTLNGSSMFFQEGQKVKYSGNEIRNIRMKTGMVFQNFQLFPHKTVLENIMEGPITVLKKDRSECEKEALSLLEKVGLSDKRDAYPGQLSGGQKQRVGIARALANNPSILLCDEATSALDPQTTASILSLLKEINEKLGITIVIITHQMSVIREICSHVAIIEHGVLVEDGLVEDIFSHPKSKAAKELILRDQPGNNNAPLANAVQERMQGDKKIRIVFSENSAFEPVIANMILQFKTPVNILRADTKNVGGVAKGEMILGLPEDRHLQVDIEEYLKEKGLAVEEVTEDVE